MTALAINAKAILVLAVGGTFITFLIVGLGSYYVLHLGLQTAFVFAALKSATDPVSVLSYAEHQAIERFTPQKYDFWSVGRRGN